MSTVDTEEEIVEQILKEPTDNAKALRDLRELREFLKERGLKFHDWGVRHQGAQKYFDVKICFKLG